MFTKISNSHIHFILLGLIILPSLLFHKVNAQTIINVAINQPSALVASAGADADICLGDTLVIGGLPVASGGTLPYSYAWSPPTGLSGSAVANPAAFPNTTTTYLLAVTDANSCQQTGTVVITVNNLPVADFAYTASNLTISFSDSSSNAVSWSWDFDDGNSSVSEDPGYTYSTGGTYNVCLTVTDAFGCVDSTCKSVVAVATGISELSTGETLSIYPNPYTGQTLISYSLTEKANVTLEVHNLLGAKIETLVNENQQPGAYKYNFSAESSGNAQGIYVVKLKLNNSIYIRKIIEMR